MMPSPLVIDTPGLLWFLTNDSRLSEYARRALRSADLENRLIIIPIIVLVEALRLVEKQKTSLKMEMLLDQLRARENVQIRNLDMTILSAMRELASRMEMHDRMIATTARLYGATV